MMKGEMVSADPLSCIASVVPYRAFRTSDGDILIGGANDRLFSILCTCLGTPEWAADVRFSTNSSRVANRETLEAAIESITMMKSTKAWLDTFEGTGLPYAKVNDLKDTLEHEHGITSHFAYFQSILNHHFEVTWIFIG
jgi:succinate---hydroxymethylglutarate CoA-transferase